MKLPSSPPTSNSLRNGFLGGVYIGRKISEALFAEKVADYRHVIRRAEQSNDGVRTTRIGEVFGSKNVFQACRMNGDTVCVKRSLRQAAQALCEN